jgi:hypothetical protein
MKTLTTLTLLTILTISTPTLARVNEDPHGNSSPVAHKPTTTEIILIVVRDILATTGI